MEFDAAILSWEEQAALMLRTLYQRRGYSRYRMSKFEEYDLYARNKDYLISGNVITFTDAGGKLMALKPDVTLSIVRSGRDLAPGMQKLCYQENVYRCDRLDGPFRELTQVGVECMGGVDDGAVEEVVLLAAESLEKLGGEYRLRISHLDLLSGLVDRLGVDGETRRQVLEFLRQKNPHDLQDCLTKAHANGAAAEALLELLRCSGAAEAPALLPLLRSLDGGSGAAELLSRLCQRVGPALRIDISLVSNLKYYNGLVFEGFMSGSARAVLSGGQYDQLMARLGRTDRAVGFAVYLDRLPRRVEQEVARA